MVRVDALHVTDPPLPTFSFSLDHLPPRCIHRRALAKMERSLTRDLDRLYWRLRLFQLERGLDLMFTQSKPQRTEHKWMKKYGWISLIQFNESLHVPLVPPSTPRPEVELKLEECILCGPKEYYIPGLPTQKGLVAPWDINE